MNFSDSPRQRALERMMMAVPRFRPKGSGKTLLGLDSSVRVNMMSVVHATTTAVNLTRSVARAAGK